MEFSHSKLNTIFTNPADYWGKYVQKISLKVGKTALEIGSMFHWGIEHNTADVTGYIEEQNLTGEYDCRKEITMAEGMLRNFFKHQEDVKDKMLTKEDGSKYELLEEYHELRIEAPLKSKVHDEMHTFVGVIDLLLLTNEGFIVVDYKTSSREPDWDKYLDQIRKYCFLLNSKFPEVPIIKIAVIGVKKSAIRLGKNESTDAFLTRLANEYDTKDDFVSYNEFGKEYIISSQNDRFVNNLTSMADLAEYIINTKAFFVNFNTTIGEFGKCDLFDLYYQTQDAEALYKIEDPIYDEDMGELMKYRGCLPIDSYALLNPDKNVLNHYIDFEKELNSRGGTGVVDLESPEQFIEDLKKVYTTDKNLLTKYIKNAIHIKKLQTKEDM